MSHNSLGVIPSFNAWVSVAVPYSSVPQMYNVLLFLVPERFRKHNLGNFGRRPYAREYLVDAINCLVSHTEAVIVAHLLYTSALSVLPMMFPSSDKSESRTWTPLGYHTQMGHVIAIWQG